MRSVKIPNPGVDKPYGPVSGGKNARAGARELLNYGFGGTADVYGPAAKYDRKPNLNKDSIPNGHTCKPLSQR